MNGRPLPDGRWLLEHGGRRWTAPADVARCWLRDGPPAGLSATPRRRARRRPRLTLAPARCVARAGRILAPFTAGPAPVLLAAGGLLAVASAWGRPCDAAWPRVLGWVLVLGLLHELGHAAGLTRGGGRPGAVGVGWAVAVPVLWCDVTEAALLPPRDRVRADLAGPALQLGGAGLATLAGAALDLDAPILAGRAAVLAALVSLLPLARTDGGWALADALDLQDLAVPLPASASRRRRRAARAARAAAAVTPWLLLAWVLWRVRGIIVRTSTGPPLLIGAAGLAVLLLLVPATLALGRRSAALLAADRTTRRRNPSDPPA